HPRTRRHARHPARRAAAGRVRPRPNHRARAGRRGAGWPRGDSGHRSIRSLLHRSPSATATSGDPRSTERRRSTRYYIDPKTARVVGSYSARNWMARWLYHGLHSVDFPWLYNYRPAWDIVVIVFMLGGTALCVTSFILAWRVVGRKLAIRVSENLAVKE